MIVPFFSSVSTQFSYSSVVIENHCSPRKRASICSCGWRSRLKQTEAINRALIIIAILRRRRWRCSCSSYCLRSFTRCLDNFASIFIHCNVCSISILNFIRLSVSGIKVCNSGGSFVAEGRSIRIKVCGSPVGINLISE